MGGSKGLPLQQGTAPGSSDARGRVGLELTPLLPLLQHLQRVPLLGRVWGSGEHPNLAINSAGEGRSGAAGTAAASSPTPPAPEAAAKQTHGDRTRLRCFLCAKPDPPPDLPQLSNTPRSPPRRAVLPSAFLNDAENAPSSPRCCTPTPPPRHPPTFPFLHLER